VKGYLIKKSEIDASDGEFRQHFLNDNAQRMNLSLGDLTGLTGIGFHIIEVPAGRDSTEYHAHGYEDECVYVLSGSGTVTIGDRKFDVAEGDFIGYRAGGEAHGMTNTGTESLRCIVVGQRLDHDVSDYPHLGKRLFRNSGQPWSLVDTDQISNP